MLLSPHLYTDWRQWLIATILIYLSVILCDVALTHSLLVLVWFTCLPLQHQHIHSQCSHLVNESSLSLIQCQVYFDAVNLAFFCLLFVCSLFTLWQKRVLKNAIEFKSMHLELLYFKTYSFYFNVTNSYGNNRFWIFNKQ